MSVLKRNFFYNALLSVSQILFPLISFPYASRVLGPEAIGAVNFADNFTTYFLILAGLGIPLYGVREIAKVKDQPAQLGKVFSELLSIHLLTSLVAVMLLFGIALFTERLRTNLGLYQIGVCIVLSSVFLAEWFFSGIEQFRFITLRSVCVRFLTLALLFLLVRTTADRNMYYALNLIGIVVTAVINMYAVSRHVRLSFKGLTLSRHFRPLLIVFSNTAITTIYLVFDSIILGFLTNDTTVGYYSASMRISKLSLVIISVLSTVLLPRLTLAFQNDNWDEAKLLLSKSLNFVIFLSLPIAIGTFCLSREMILLFAGEAFLPAVDALKILCFISIVVGLAGILSIQILLPLHQEKRILYASLFGVVTSLLLNFILIPHFRHVGAAISSFSTELIVTFVLFIHVRRFIRIRFPIRPLIQSILTCLLFFLIKFAVLQVTAVPLLIVLLTVGLCGSFYLLVQVFVWRNPDVIDILSGFSMFKSLFPKK